MLFQGPSRNCRRPQLTLFAYKKQDAGNESQQRRDGAPLGNRYIEKGRNAAEDKPNSQKDRAQSSA